MRLEKKDDNPKKGEMTYDEKQFVEGEIFVKLV